VTAQLCDEVLWFHWVRCRGQLNHLDYIAQFTTDVRHISGQDNVVADARSCVESITAPPSHKALAASQESDDELLALLSSDTALRLEKQQILGTAISIYCNTSAGKPRPYVPALLRLQVFQSVHDLSHSGTKATAKLVAQRFVWPGVHILTEGQNLPCPHSFPLKHYGDILSSREIQHSVVAAVSFR
jgi:hypothetical protein